MWLSWAMCQVAIDRLPASPATRVLAWGGLSPLLRRRKPVAARTAGSAGIVWACGGYNVQKNDPAFLREKDLKSIHRSRRPEHLPGHIGQVKWNLYKTKAFIPYSSLTSSPGSQWLTSLSTEKRGFIAGGYHYMMIAEYKCATLSFP